MNFLALLEIKLPDIEAACSMESVGEEFSHDHAKRRVGYSNLCSRARKDGPLQCTIKMSDHLNIFVF